MDNYNKALEVAVKSKDSNLISLVLHKMMRMKEMNQGLVEEKLIHKLFSQFEISS